ncbi:MAG: bile acid:sodium symporter family protein [Thiohalophilus sp.]|uniref:bile acid:sodium symporter family protein n=1 Tax=Thiohalophilus sp. TaxID=3028392 RepID=UPI0028707806|nr:bile acid:sodium symporter family protein [Thiohalophilus sp.]MDR9435323.1 bile acid:sodium symporter family protein [Thiohalophilus sp.]
MLVFRFIANALAPLTLLAAVLAWWHPPLFLIFKPVFIWLFAATMFAVGVTLDRRELIATLQQPLQIAQGVMTQYTLMPLLAFTIVMLVDLPPALALGFIIVGCAPGAMASNVMVYLAGGAVALSIAMTTVSTLLSPLLTPVLVEWLGGEFIPVPLAAMMRTIVVTVVVPVGLGLWLQPYLGRYLTTARDVAPGIAAVAIIIICAYAMANAVNHNALAMQDYGLSVLGLVVLLNALGYAGGWLLARLYGFDRRRRLTLAIEIGMQNAGLGVVLALAHFADQPQTALPGALFAVWCIVTAAGATTWFRRRAARLASETLA